MDIFVKSIKSLGLMDIGMRNYDLRTLIDDVEAEASSFLYREVCSGIEIWRCGCLPHSFKSLFR